MRCSQEVNVLPRRIPELMNDIGGYFDALALCLHSAMTDMPVLFTRCLPSHIAPQM
jgi:hypothetical protein